MRSFSFQGFPAEKVQDEVNQGSQGEAGQGGEQVGRGQGEGEEQGG
jgi:hypothetical protein